MVPAPRSAAALPIAFSGAPGSYSEEAARRFFGQGEPTLTCDDARASIEAVATGRARRAVVAVENSITGCFAGVADALCDRPLSVHGEVLLPIRHCLLGAPGTRVDEVSVVTSHPMALAHCRDWLARAGVATRTMPDTARAARELADSGDAALAVIGSRTLAALYGLQVLAEGLSDLPNNVTRFLVLGPEGAGAKSGTRTSLLVGPVHAPRVVRTLRIQIEARDARRVRVPFLGSEDGRCFLAEFDHDEGAGERIASDACAGLEHRVLGSWTPERAA